MKVALALYRLLLLGLERDTRHRYGEEMSQAFSCALSDSRKNGLLRCAGTAVAMFVDLARCVVHDRARALGRLLPDASRRPVPIGIRPRPEVSRAVRRIRGAPVASMAIVASVALSTGAATGLFSVADAVLLRPLPVRDPDRLVMVVAGQESTFSWTYPIWEEIERSGVLDVAAWDRNSLSAGARGELGDLEVLWVSGSFFDLLGIQPRLGRLLSADDAPQTAPGAVLGHRFWRTRFDGDPSVLGQTLVLDGTAFVVVGVSPEGFGGIEVDHAFDVAIPFETEPLVRGARSTLHSPYQWGIRILGRLSPGDSAAGASARLRAVQDRIKAATLVPQWPPEAQAEYLSEPLGVAPAVSGVSWLGRRYGPALWVLLGTVGLLVALAATNTASLLAVRVLHRRAELGVHSALGATPLRIALPILFESLLLTGAGVAVGQWIATGCSRYLLSSVGASSYSIGRASPLELRVVVFAVALLLLVAVLSGLIPAIQAGRVDPLAAIRGASPSIGRGRLAGTLVANQVALSLALLIVATLAIQTFLALARRPLGFEGRGLLIAKLDLEIPDGGDLSTRAQQLVSRAREALVSLPEVEAAAGSAVTPLNLSASTAVWYCREGGAEPATDAVLLNLVTPGWFETYRTRLVAGRTFSVSDGPGAPGVALVNRAFAAAFPCEGPVLGAELRERDASQRPGPPVTVVGIVENAVYRRYRETPPPTVYRPWSDLAGRPVITPLELSIRLRTGVPPTAWSRIEAALLDLSPGLSVELEPFERRLDGAVRSERLLAVLSSGLALLGALLAVIGTYGVVSHEVSGRQREAAIRLSLGASSVSLWVLALRRAALALTLGVMAGEGLGFALGRAAHARIGATPPDSPLTYAGAAALLAVATLAAVASAAGRALSAQPSRLLRQLD